MPMWPRTDGRRVGPLPLPLLVLGVLGALMSLACPRAGGEEKSSSVVLPSGRRYAIEVAATRELRSRGLMYRESLADRHGMLFLFPKPSVEGFWMKNCNFPIDIVWMDAARRVQFISAHTPPCREEDCPTYGPKVESMYVLEIPEGAAEREKIIPGSEIKLENIPPPPEH